MKTGLPNLTFLCNFLQLLLSNISLFTVLFTAYFVYLFIFYFFAAFWLGICVEMEVEIITTPHYPAPPRPYVFALTHISLLDTSDSYSKSVRLKLVSVPLSSLLLDIGHLEKSFPESIM